MGLLALVGVVLIGIGIAGRGENDPVGFIPMAIGVVFVLTAIISQ